MPADLTGQQINNIYTSLLHISSTALTNIPTPIFDGVGNRSALYLSTSSVSVTGSFDYIFIKNYNFSDLESYFLFLFLFFGFGFKIPI
jgi:hypothetical protein